jgi:hypothetical protein
MKGKVIAVVKNEDDRTVDMTVEAYTDANVLIQTDNLILPIDLLSRDLANERIKEHLNRIIVGREPFPYTDAELDALLVGMVTVVPE